MAEALLRLLGLTLLGYLLFKPSAIHRRVLPVFTFLMINIMFPLYSITRYGMNWEEAVTAGPFWLIVFFFIGVATLALQYGGVKLLLKQGAFPRLRDENRSEFILLFAVHNAGYIPLPILQVVAPAAVTVYMFSYILAFQLIFWSFVISIITSDSAQGIKIRIKPNMPLAGLLIGLLLASTGLYGAIPELLRDGAEFIAAYAMDGILIVLGGILAGIPHDKLRSHREFLPFVVWRQIVWPGGMLLLMVLLRLAVQGGGLFPGTAITLSDSWRWLQLVVVLEAAAPPGTNLGIVIKAFGSREQLHYAGSGLIVSYAAAALFLPLYVWLALTV